MGTARPAKPAPPMVKDPLHWDRMAWCAKQTQFPGAKTVKPLPAGRPGLILRAKANRRKVRRAKQSQSEAYRKTIA